MLWEQKTPKYRGLNRTEVLLTHADLLSVLEACSWLDPVVGEVTMTIQLPFDLGAGPKQSDAPHLSPAFGM